MSRLMPSQVTHFSSLVSAAALAKDSSSAHAYSSSFERRVLESISCTISLKLRLSSASVTIVLYSGT